MSWIDHHGLGCPVPFDTTVETVDPTGERHIGAAGDPMNVDENGNSWVWAGEEPESYEITRYRIIKETAAPREVALAQFK